MHTSNSPYGKVAQATHAGKLLNDIDCYVLDDGPRVIPEAGIVRMLCGDVPTTLSLQELLALLPAACAALKALPPIKFRLPDGSRASGHEAMLVASMLQAYVDAHFDNELVAEHRHLASNAFFLLKHFQKVGMVALVSDSAGCPLF